MTKGAFMSVIEMISRDYYKDAPQSILRNNHMNNLKGDEVINKDVVEAVIVDFINFIGMKQGLDYGMYIKDLYNERIRND